jgi:hypothetical protein
MAANGTIFGKHGLPDSPTSHGRCPICDHTNLWVAKSGEIAKCFNADCERYGKPWFARTRKANNRGWCVAALNPFADACIEYLRTTGQGDPLRQKAINYLVKTRCIEPEVIGEVRIEIVPPGLDVEPFIRAAQESPLTATRPAPTRLSLKR